MLVLLGKKILRKSLTPVFKILRVSSFFYRFIFPNLKSFLNGRILYDSWPQVQQITICAGKGIVILGKNVSLGYKMGGFHRSGSIELQARYENAKIKIGKNVSTNNNIFLCAANYIEIGDHTLIGQNVVIMDHEAHGIEPEKRRQLGEIGQVIVGENVWIGNNVSILKNSEIGRNSIVATGAVVAGSFPENVIIGGVPARIIKNING